MKKITLTAFCAAFSMVGVNAATINLSTDTVTPAAAFGTDFEGTLNDPFAYDQTDPVGTPPDVVLGTTNGYHSTGGSPAVLRYTLTDGSYTVSSGESVFMDLWGRDSSAFNESRDDDFDVTLYNGDYVTTVATVTNQAIDADHHHRVNFTSLSAGDQFDRVEIVARNSSGETNNNFVLMETRLASEVIPEPSSTVLLGLATVGFILRRRR